MLDIFNVTVNSHETLIVENNFYNEYRTRKNYVAWLLIDGVNVGMIRYLVGGNEIPMICDIEIREEHRGNKLGLRLIHLIENELINDSLHTSGNYTPEGYRALSNKIPVNSYNGDNTPKLAHSSINFVLNWDEFQLDGF